MFWPRNNVSSFPATPSAAPQPRSGGRIPAASNLAVHANANAYIVTGNGTIKRLPAWPIGTRFEFTFTGTPTFTNSTKLQCPNGVNKTFAAKESAEIVCIDNRGTWVLYPKKSAEVDADGTLAANSDNVVPSQKAVKTYIDAKGAVYSPSWNATCEIWQRGTSFAGITTGTYTMDRMINGPGNGGSATVTREAFALNETALPRGGSRYYHQMAWTGVPTSGESRTGYTDYFASHELRHENVDRYAGAVVTVSVYAKVASGSVPFYLYASMGLGSGGTHGKTGNTISGTGAGTDYNFMSNEVFLRSARKTMTSTWTRYSETFTLDDFSAATLGSSGDVLTIGLGFDIGYGPTVSTWGLQIDFGTVALPVSRRDRGTLLMLAKRHHYRLGQMRGVTTNSTTIEVSFDIPTEIAGGGPAITMATTTPTFLTGGAGAVGSSLGSGSAWSAQSITQYGIRGTINGFSGISAGYPAQSRTNPVLILSNE